MAPVVHGNPPPYSFWDFQSSLEMLRGWILEEKASRRRYGVRFPPDDPISSSGIRMNPCIEFILPWEVTSIIGPYVARL